MDLPPGVLSRHPDARDAVLARLREAEAAEEEDNFTGERLVKHRQKKQTNISSAMAEG